MLKFLGIPAKVSREREVLRGAPKLLLPGVGAFDGGMEQLQKHDLVGLLNECVVERKIPVLGICLGMQLLTRGSEGGQPARGLAGLRRTASASRATAIPRAR